MEKSMHELTWKEMQKEWTKPKGWKHQVHHAGLDSSLH